MSVHTATQSLLDDPVAIELLTSRVPARLAYTWLDGSPRVVPIWFHWDGIAIVLATPPRAPKLKALQPTAPVAVTIDSAEWPYHVLSVRGTAEVTIHSDVVPEYAAAAERYLGHGPAQDLIGQFKGHPMARIRIEPTWVNILDFETRWPSALST